MTQQEIKNLENDLWAAADTLRANSKLTAAEYKDPLLGLILLRFAENRYEDAKIEIEKSLPAMVGSAGANWQQIRKKRLPLIVRRQLCITASVAVAG